MSSGNGSDWTPTPGDTSGKDVLKLREEGGYVLRVPSLLSNELAGPPPPNLIDLAAKRRAKGLPEPVTQPELEAADLSKKPVPRDGCKHLNITLDTEDRTVSCTCGVKRDAFDALEGYADYFEEYKAYAERQRTMSAHRRKELLAEIDQLTKTRDKLRREVNADPKIKLEHSYERAWHVASRNASHHEAHVRRLQRQLKKLGQEPVA